LLDVDSDNVRPLTGRTLNESQPAFSPDGSRIAHWYPRDGENRNVNEIYIGPANGGDTASCQRRRAALLFRRPSLVPVWPQLAC
jgi:Tol biopolymer transport system component